LKAAELEFESKCNVKQQEKDRALAQEFYQQQLAQIKAIKI
jgi:hypothetical protein